MKIVRLEDAISEAKRLAEEKLAVEESADEFVEIGEADGFKLCVTAGKTIKDEFPISFHDNPRDLFMLILEGEIEFTFERGEKTIVKAGECFVLPKHLKHHCVFKKMTIAIEGLYEKAL
ncbi:MAG: cupin domain-containing protein [Candidatus Bathyarchaeota archaeon]|nr:cupin domain-containing protein [Candidatus Bathyarchaeota archaeon]